MHETLAATREYDLLKLIPLLPLLGAAWNGFFGKALQKRYGERPISIVGCGTAVLSFLFSAAAVLALRSGSGPLADRMYDWIRVGELGIPVSLLVDPLSAVMILVVTGVGSLIHIYSIGYMHGDRGYYRYFSFLNLFLFSMLTLVLGDNLLLLFVGWEGVGLCSYLLIGFWFTDREKAVAGMKAFLTNRIGDLGFIVGLFALWWLLAKHGAPTLSFPGMAAAIDGIANDTVLGLPAPAFIGVALFIGAAGKSAQIPLYVWLPDAMAGPTPVSALIHAATMVTAGVYMIARMNFLYSLAPQALAVVATVGAATALFAATIGVAQTDIKKVLAYSTVSQLGYMMLGVGVGAYAAGIFHLMTHAFFKACLFLSAGSVIHAMGGEQDIRKMGGLREKMPVTFAAMLLATLAIAGVPGFSGFFSKDEILWNAWAGPHGHPALWAAGFLGAGLTAFYMFRLVFLVFFGECRADEETKHHVHESPRVVTVPLVVLGALSVAGGWIGVPEALGGSNRFHHYLAPVFSAGAEAEAAEHASRSLEYLLMLLSVGVAASGIALAHLFYMRRRDLPGIVVSRIPRLHRLVENKYWVDEIYRATVIGVVLFLSQALRVFDDYVIDGFVNLSGWVVRGFAVLSGWFDNTFVDGLVNAVSNGTIALGSRARRLQTGAVQSYVIAVFGGILLLIALYLGLRARA